MADFVDRSFIEHHRLLFGLTSTQFLDIKAVDEIANFIQAPLYAPMIGDIIRGRQQAINSLIELTAGACQVALKIKLASSIEVGIGSSEPSVSFRRVNSIRYRAGSFQGRRFERCFYRCCQGSPNATYLTWSAGREANCREGCY